MSERFRKMEAFKGRLDQEHIREDATAYDAWPLACEIHCPKRFLAWVEREVIEQERCIQGSTGRTQIKRLDYRDLLKEIAETLRGLGVEPGHLPWYKEE